MVDDLIDGIKRAIHERFPSVRCDRRGHRLDVRGLTTDAGDTFTISFSFDTAVWLVARVCRGDEYEDPTSYHARLGEYDDPELLNKLMARIQETVIEHRFYKCGDRIGIDPPTKVITTRPAGRRP
jgi:hypothetical protein